MLYLDTDVSELKTIHAAAKKLIGKNSGVPNSILLESSANKLISKIVSCGDWLSYQAKLRGNSKGEGAFIIPIDKLESLASAPAKSKVSFTGDGGTQINVVLDSGSFSRQFKLETPPLQEFPPIEFPDEFAMTDTTTFLAHLENAALCTSKEPSRYSFNMIELDGDKGRVVATDGRQLFCGNSMQFPWPGKKYLRLDPILSSKSIIRSGDIGFSVTDKRFFVRFGPWTLSQFTDCPRFPDIDPVIPAKHDLRTSITLSDQQAKDLLDAIAVLPGGGEGHSAIKLTARDKLTVAALDPESDQEKYITLDATISDVPRSTCFNRHFLVQALEAGFRQFFIVLSTGAVLAVTANSKYIFMPTRGANEDSGANQDNSPRVEAVNESKVKDSAHAAASTISTVSQPETSTTNEKEKTMDQGTTAVVNPPASQNTGATAQTGQSSQASDKPAPVSGLHQPPLQGPVMVITPEAIMSQITTAKDAVRNANASLCALQDLVRDFVKQSKDREKQNSAAAKKLEVIQRMAA